MIIAVIVFVCVGLKVLHQKFPEGLLTGSIPQTCLQSPPGTARGVKSSASSRQPSTRGQREVIPVVGSIVHKETFSLDGKCSTLF